MHDGDGTDGGGGERSGIRELAIVRVEGAAGEARRDALAVEDPLEIQVGYEKRGWRVHQSVSITMRTPGHDTELAVGFLFTEGILADPAAQIETVGRPPVDGQTRGQTAGNVVRVELRPGVTVDLRKLERHFYTTSSCGVCGKTSIEALGLSRPGRVLLPGSGPVFAAALIHTLPDRLRETQSVFDRTGGLHAAALFGTGGELVALREDVGRHNAVDKLIGSQLRAGAAARGAMGERLLFVSGRASFELMQKALAAGIPILAAVGAPSSLAVELARHHGATLLGFVRGGRFNIYSGEGRIGGVAARAAGEASPDDSGGRAAPGHCEFPLNT